MPKLLKYPRYELRATMRGKLVYMCPICGMVQEHRIDWKQWRVRCYNEECRRTYAVAMLFRPLAGVNPRGAIPPDMVFPRVPIVRPRGRREPMHTLMDDDAPDPELVRLMRDNLKDHFSEDDDGQ